MALEVIAAVKAAPGAPDILGDCMSTLPLSLRTHFWVLMESSCVNLGEHFVLTFRSIFTEGSPNSGGEEDSIRGAPYQRY